jgi:hypothetical protein
VGCDVGKSSRNCFILLLVNTYIYIWINNHMIFLYVWKLPPIIAIVQSNMIIHQQMFGYPIFRQSHKGLQSARWIPAGLVHSTCSDVKQRDCLTFDLCSSLCVGQGETFFTSESVHCGPSIELPHRCVKVWNGRDAEKNRKGELYPQ